MVYCLISKPLLVILFTLLQVLLNGHCLEKVSGKHGRNVTLSFKFKGIVNASIISAVLYQNKTKIYDCCVPPKTCICTANNVCVVHKAFNITADFCIHNLTSGNDGVYSVRLIFEYIVPLASNEVVLVVNTDNFSTDSTSSVLTNNSSRNFAPVVLAVLGVPGVLVLVGLLGLLWWKFKRNSVRNTEGCNSETQVSVETADPIQVCSVVYSVLNFPGRPQGEGKTSSHQKAEIRPTEEVEYAAITFHPRQQAR